MAGGKITRICNGSFVSEISGSYECYTDKFEINAGGKSTIGGKKETKKGEPEKAKSDHKHIIRGWWSADTAGNKPIREALLGDIVYFHAETENIADGDGIFMSLFDDDVHSAKEEQDDSKGSDRIVLNGKQDDFVKVKGNKVVRKIDLTNLSKWVESEADKTIELFFTCSYKKENVQLPVSFADYLKVKGMPKIIFVNGHWNNIANKIGMSPGQGGEKYWDFFTGKFQSFKNQVDIYLNYNKSEEYFIDGSSLWGGSENGQERKDRGYKYAKEHFNEINKRLGGQPICLISHSEGGACASGVAKYLIEQGVNIKESILLSCDEGDEFIIENNYPSYQLVAGYLDIDIITKKSYFKIDPVVKDNKIKGVTKYGVYISKSSFTTVHGATVDSFIFDLLKKLKLLRIEQVWNAKGKIVYQTSPKDENWAKIDDYILNNSKVDYYPTSNSNIVEFYKKRED
ncbi:hypothetical protein [Flavobacterium covae]